MYEPKNRMIRTLLYPFSVFSVSKQAVVFLTLIWWQSPLNPVCLLIHRTQTFCPVLYLTRINITKLVIIFLYFRTFFQFTFQLKLNIEFEFDNIEVQFQVAYNSLVLILQPNSGLGLKPFNHPFPTYQNVFNIIIMRNLKTHFLQ